jgi:hypothetical protein
MSFYLYKLIIETQYQMVKLSKEDKFVFIELVLGKKVMVNLRW